MTNLTPASGVYTTILMGAGAIGFATAAPRTGYGTELLRKPDAGNGGGQTTLHSRMNVGIHPLGYAWSDGTGGSAIAADSSSIAEPVRCCPLVSCHVTAQVCAAGVPHISK